MVKELKSFLIGSVGFIIFAMMRPVTPLHNMEFFVAACVIFVSITILAYFIIGMQKTDGKPAQEKIWSISAVILLAVWMILFYINEPKAEHPLDGKIIRRYFPFPLWIGLMAAGVAVCLFILRKEQGEKRLKLRKGIRAVTALLFTIGTSVQFYAPNIFQDIQGGTYHSHAYTNSIINACWLIPYSKNMQSLYGHYGIIFMPVLKFLHKCFHVDYLTGIFIVSAVLAGISILLFIYILNYFAKSDLIFYLAMFAIGEEYFMILQGGVYLQVHPHRMIFPMILAAIALQEYKTGKKYNVLAVIMNMFSFIWSTEVGIATMLSFALFRWMEQILDGEAFSVKKALLLIRELAVHGLLPFALAYMAVTGYNLVAGGAVLDFREFMFPLISDRNYIDKIELTLPDVTHAWVGTAVLFLGAVCPAMFQALFPSADEKGKGLKPYYFFLGMMSLVLMLYYINRPAEGSMFIIMFLMLILQASILQKGQDVYLEWRQKKDSLFAIPGRFVFLSLRVVTTLILFIMAFDSIYSMPGAFKKSAETVWKRDELIEFAQYVYVQIPPDAVSFGEGVPELMSMIDRDTHLHSTEWSYLNMPLDTMEEIRYALEDEEWFFCSLDSLHYMQSNYPGLTDSFYLHEEMEYNGRKFGFFRAVEE
ncbi:hypothetical protein D3Z60_05255 [Lachnospiraceae bacterium]|jgi:hypothetical protein|nr:hypothetical protein [Lachnospiraceae bacterium]